jgi:hypothetical protein
MTVGTAIDLAWEEIQATHSPTSHSSYLSHVRRFRRLWGELPLEAVTRQLLQAYVNERRQEVKAATVHSEISFVSKVLSTAYQAGQDVGRPSQGLRLPSISNKRKRALTEGEAASLREALGRSWPVALFAIMTGLRRLEIFRLRPADVVLWEVDRSPTEDGHGLITTRLGYVTIHETLALTQRYVHLDQTALWPAAMALCKAGKLAHWPACLPPAPPRGNMNHWGPSLSAASTAVLAQVSPPRASSIASSGPESQNCTLRPVGPRGARPGWHVRQRTALRSFFPPHWGHVVAFMSLLCTWPGHPLPWPS